MSDVADCKSRLHATFCLVQLVGKLQACVQDKGFDGGIVISGECSTFSSFERSTREEDGVFLLEGSVIVAGVVDACEVEVDSRFSACEEDSQLREGLQVYKQRTKLESIVVWRLT